MDQHEAQRLLRRQLDERRALPYSELVARIDTEERAAVVGPSGVEYQFAVQYFWDDPARRNVRVMGAIDDGGLRAFFPITDSFIMAPSGTFVGEAPT